VAAIRLDRRLPGDSSDRTRGPAEPAVGSSYLALLQVGFTEPAGLPAAGGLLPHHFTFAAAYAPAVYFLWHSPSGHPDRALPGTLLCGARTFLDGNVPPRLPGGLAINSTRGFGWHNPPHQPRTEQNEAGRHREGDGQAKVDQWARYA